jgi:uncharacterized Rossmann fold enzyme
MSHTELKLVNLETKFLPMNIQYSASLKLPFVEKNDLANERGVVVCGTAPTLVKAPVLREIKRLKGLGFKICAVKQAIRILKEYDIQPDFSVSMDPGEKQIKKTPLDPNVTYYLASSCHPRMFNYLMKGGANVVVFHSACGASQEDLSEMCLYAKHYPENCSIESVASGGYTVVNRAISLCQYRGAQRIFIAGAPFGWREGDDYYAPTVTEPAGNASGPVLDDQKRVDGKLWYTKADLLPSAVSIARKVKLDPMRFEFLGDSLAASLAKHSDEFINRIIPTAC